MSQPGGNAAPNPTSVDWGLYHRLKAEGRLNLLFRLSEPFVSKFTNNWAVAPASRPNVLPFVSREEHLAWRAQWKRGRFSILSPSAELRAATLRQDETYRRADATWALRHGAEPGGATVTLFEPNARTELSTTDGA